jgi:hypothetical protein
VGWRRRKRGSTSPRSSPPAERKELANGNGNSSSAGCGCRWLEKVNGEQKKIMKLKYKVTNKEELAPEELPFYTERDGALVLDLDGAIDRKKLDDFQKEKISLLTHCVGEKG